MDGSGKVAYRMAVGIPNRTVRFRDAVLVQIGQMGLDSLA